MSISSRACAGVVATLIVVTVSGCGGDTDTEPSKSNSALGNSALGDAAGGASPDYTPTGPLLADSGYRPSANGFSFENYTNDKNPTNLTPQSMRAMFGDSVCENTANGGCTLIPQSEAWMQKTNEEMGNGHCYGMSSASLLMYMRKLDSAGFGGDAGHALSFDGNSPLQEMLAQQWAAQTFSEVHDRVVAGAPSQVLDTLIASLKPDAPETYTISFWKPDMTGGHAISPYAVEDKGEGKVSILVYDNNFPGVTRHMDVDRTANTWQYEAATNPSESSELYQGDAQTETFKLFPSTPALGLHKFPYEGHASANASATAAAGPPPLTVYLEGDAIHHGHLLITDDQGRRLGFANGKRINEIPGTRTVDLVAGRNSSPEPDYQLPSDAHYTITVDGTGLPKSDRTHVGIIGDAFAVDVSDIDLAPGARSTIDMSPVGDRVTYTSTDAQSPAVEIGENYEHADYIFTARNVAVGPGGTATITRPSNRDLFTVDSAKSGKAGSVGVEMRRIDDVGTRTFKHDGVSVAAGGSAEFDFDDWDGGGKSMGLTVSENGKRTTTKLPTD
ncbi:hypothetical protein [Nocardia sp. NPDC051570]|uniref:hypothetical protein n=1 Tax=Nocardia sp. NPDC051570 TaxID=3364324 RepID=UPI0037B1AD85